MENEIKVKTRIQSLKDFVKSGNFLKPFLGIVLGGVAGFLYYHFIGCSSGTCAITSNPYMSTGYGSFFGWFLLNSPCSRGKC